MPNIKASFYWDNGGNLGFLGGAASTRSNKCAASGNNWTGRINILDFNASLASPIYRDDIQTVQPPALKSRVYTYYA